MHSFHCSDSRAKPHRFFKIILSDIASHTKLMIPPEFVMKYGKDLHDRIYLKVLNGKDWPVDLERNNDKIWLHNGWPEFARFYSICFGHFVFFEYLGPSSFHVIVFDPSCTEIDYPLAGSNSRELIKAIKRETVIDDPTACDVRPCKKTKANTAVDEANLNGEKLMGKAKQNKGKGIKIMSHVTSESKKDGVNKADKSKNRVFVVKMRRSYVSGRYSLTLSKNFVTQHITKGQNNITLQNSDGRVRSVTCHVYGTCAILSGGWKEFAQENNLAVGDVCAFELINSAEKLVKVVISRTQACLAYNFVGDENYIFQEFCFLAMVN